MFIKVHQQRMLRSFPVDLKITATRAIFDKIPSIRPDVRWRATHVALLSLNSLSRFLVRQCPLPNSIYSCLGRARIWSQDYTGLRHCLGWPTGGTT